MVADTGWEISRPTAFPMTGPQSSVLFLYENKGEGTLFSFLLPTYLIVLQWNWEKRRKGHFIQKVEKYSFSLEVYLEVCFKF